MGRRGPKYPRRRAKSARRTRTKRMNPGSALRVGIYTVSTACRIVPRMTKDKVHYWLDVGAIGEAIRGGRRGVPTLLTFEQVLRISILERMRHDLKVSLRKARKALQWVVDHVTADEWAGIRLYRTGTGDVGFTDGKESFSIPAEQGVLDATLPELQAFLEESRRNWEAQVFPIEGFEHLVSDPQIMAGAPIIAGTRIETAFIGHLADGVEVAEIRAMFPHVEPDAIAEAAEFEGVELAA